MEHRIYPVGQTPPVSTYGFHEHRERAPHLEQPIHQERLLKAYQFIRTATQRLRERGYPATVTDLGCGDGGLLSLLKPDVDAGRVDDAWGYDFQPSNAAGWVERGVKAAQLNIFNSPGSRVNPQVVFGDVTVMTEVLEHLEDPHGVLHDIWMETAYVVASSPHTETRESHDECHAWCWNVDGYRAMFRGAGYEIVAHETVGMFQVILAVSQ
jgi:SAM-dependent methyltransferase